VNQNPIQAFEVCPLNFNISARKFIMAFLCSGALSLNALPSLSNTEDKQIEDTSFLAKELSLNSSDASFIINDRPVLFNVRGVDAQSLEAELAEGLKTAQEDDQSTKKAVVLLDRSITRISRAKQALKELSDDRLSVQIIGNRFQILYCPTGQFSTSTEEVVRLFESLAILHYKFRKYELAEHDLLQAQQLTPIDSHPLEAAAIDDVLSWVYRAKGDFVKAEEVASESLHLRRKALPTSDPRLAAGYLQVADLLYDKGQPQVAHKFEMKAKSTCPLSEGDIISKVFPANQFDWRDVTASGVTVKDEKSITESENDAEVMNFRTLLTKILPAQNSDPKITDATRKFTVQAVLANRRNVYIPRRRSNLDDLKDKLEEETKAIKEASERNERIRRDATDAATSKLDAIHEQETQQQLDDQDRIQEYMLLSRQRNLPTRRW